MGKKIFIIIIILIVVPIAYWLIAPVFIDKEVSEAIPLSTKTELNNKSIPIIETQEPKIEKEPIPGDKIEAQEPKIEKEPVSGDIMGKKDIAPPSLEKIEEVNYEKSGQFVGLAGHSGQGTIRIIKVDDDYYIRMDEDFKVDNAPDMFVHLGRNSSYDKAINFGKLKGNIGSQNYKIEDAEILKTHDEVWIWCRAFSVPMGKAELKP